METVQAVSISSNQLGEQFFPVGKDWVDVRSVIQMSWHMLKAAAIDNDWGMNKKMGWISSHNPMISTQLSPAAANDIPYTIKHANSESEDAKSIHQNSLVVCN